MIKLLGKIPRHVILACSGGVDSMFALDFLLSGKRNVAVLNIDHGTEYGKKANDFVKDYALGKGLIFMSHDIGSFEPKDGQSLEAHWHGLRYDAYKSLHEIYKVPIITCHHLDDQVEQWIMTSATGNPRLISYSNEETGVIRPFLLTRKKQMREWCERKSVPFIEDPSNACVRFTRNLVRHEVVPAMLKVNPGLHKVIAKKVAEEYKLDVDSSAKFDFLQR